MIAELIQQKQSELHQLEENFKQQLTNYKNGLTTLLDVNNSYQQYGKCQLQLDVLRLVK